MKVRLVAITGGSGSGKTWLARRLKRRLGPLAGLVSLDDFYRDLAHLPPRERARLDFDCPEAIEWPRFLACLEAIRAGQSVRLPRYDFSTHTRRAATRRWAPRPIVLVEGLWLLRTAPLRKLFDLTLFVECPEQLRLERRLERDQRERRRTPAAIRRQFRLQVAPAHVRYVQPQRRWAHLNLGPDTLAGAVGDLARHLRAGAEGRARSLLAVPAIGLKPVAAP